MRKSVGVRLLMTLARLLRVFVNHFLFLLGLRLHWFFILSRLGTPDFYHPTCGRLQERYSKRDFHQRAYNFTHIASKTSMLILSLALSFRLRGWSRPRLSRIASGRMPSVTVIALRLSVNICGLPLPILVGSVKCCRVNYNVLATIKELRQHSDVFEAVSQVVGEMGVEDKKCVAQTILLPLLLYQRRTSEGCDRSGHT